MRNKQNQTNQRKKKQQHFKKSGLQQCFCPSLVTHNWALGAQRSEVRQWYIIQEWTVMDEGGQRPLREAPRKIQKLKLQPRYLLSWSSAPQVPSRFLFLMHASWVQVQTHSKNHTPLRKIQKRQNELEKKRLEQRTGAAEMWMQKGFWLVEGRASCDACRSG